MSKKKSSLQKSQCLFNFFLICRVVTGIFLPLGSVWAEKGTMQGSAASTATVLLLDSSGSMDDDDITGLTKLEAAQQAAQSILDVIQAETSLLETYQHQVGLASFSANAKMLAGISEDIASVKAAVDSLYASGGTAMPDGLSIALDMIEPVASTYSKSIILLSDGLPNIGLGGLNADADEIDDQLMTLARRANSGGICIHTIGFGDPGEGSIDEDLLKRIAAESGCGQYYNAENALVLANVFIEIRHSSLGNILLREQGGIDQDEVVDLGAVAVPQNQEVILFTLNSLGSLLNLEVTDPVGTLVDVNYPEATLKNTASLSSLVVSNPLEGDWRVKIIGANVPTGRTEYNMLMSSRQKPTPPPAPTPTPTQVVATAVPQTYDYLPTKANGWVTLLIILALGGIIGGVVYYFSKSGGAGAQKSAILVGNSAYTQGQRVPISTTLIIGRGSTANLHLEAPDISRVHAQIYTTGGRWFIQDMNSQLGTFVNEQRISTVQLSSGDRIRIGAYAWIFTTS